MIKRRASTPKTRKKSPWNLNAKLRSALRHVWRCSPEYVEAMRASRVERGKYLCSECKDLFGPKEIAVDHIEAVGPIDNLQTYRERLFCGPDGYQVLCKPCHKLKTAQERAEAKAGLDCTGI